MYIFLEIFTDSGQVGKIRVESNDTLVLNPKRFDSKRLSHFSSRARVSVIKADHVRLLSSRAEVRQLTSSNIESSHDSTRIFPTRPEVRDCI